MLSKIGDFFKGKLKLGGGGDEETVDMPAEPAIETHYDMLYVVHDAPMPVIRAAYMALVRKYHPDRNMTNPEALAMAQLVNSAWSVLSHPQKKADHDAWIAQQKTPTQSAASTSSDPQAEKLKADAKAWADLSDRAEKDAVKARERATQAAAQAATAPAHEKSKWHAWARQAEEDAKAAAEKAAKIAADAKAAAAKAGVHFARQISSTAITTHYAALRLTRGAPVEIIDAAFKVLHAEYCGETPRRAETEAAIALIEEAHRVLSNPATKAAYDATLAPKTAKKPQAAARKKSAAAPASKAPARALTQREKDANEAARRAAAMAEATVQMAERAGMEQKEVEKKAEEAQRNARDKAKDADGPKWQAWAKKMADEAAAAKKRTEKAQADVRMAKAKAEEAAQIAAAEKARADKVHAADAEAAALKRSVREQAERSERSGG